MANKYKVDDRVRFGGKIGVIDNIGFSERNEEYLYIVRFGNGQKEKVLESEIMPAVGTDVRISTGQFDEAVKTLMYEVADDIPDDEQLNGVLEIVVAVCGRLKARLFERND